MNGIFAINKPSGPSSNDVLTQLKEYLSKSPIFKDQIELQLSQLKPRQRKQARFQFVKIGHGGTLDPLADGALVIGIGQGTKKLGDYLGNCKKTYRATALFGASTTTYDSQGNIVKRSKTDHLTDEKVNSVLDQFRGKIMQTPPVYSALKMNGKPLYEYARSGEGLPKEIQPRECYIDKFDIKGDGLEWEHEYEMPKLDATDKEKEYASILDKMHLEENVDKKEEDEKDDKNPILEIEFTVSSGTYIRSLIHDLGLALGTTAHMVSLTRLQQGEWIVGKNVFELDDFLQRDEQAWEGELRNVLQNGPDVDIKSLREKKKEDKE